jgi:peptidoglycan/LPS O-acetylase OafA/YrhL
LKTQVAPIQSEQVVAQAHRRNSFDTLRLIGATMVMAGHSFIITGWQAPTIMGRGLHQFGLWIFFSLSGYLICQSWRRDSRFGPYLAKRMLRILPGLWWFLLISILIIGPIASTLPPAAYFDDHRTYLYFAKNALLMTAWSLPGVFETLPVRAQANGSLWSLAIEAGLYLLVPVMMWAWRRSAPLTFVLALLAPVGTVAIWLTKPALLQISFHGILFGWGLGVAPLFISGAIVGLAGLDTPDWRRPILPLAAVVLLVAAVLVRGNSVGAVLLAFPFALLIIAIGRSPALHFRLLDRIGDLSYGIYLSAYPIQQLAFQLSHRGPPANLLLSVPPTFALAILSWRMIEKPALSFKPGSGTPASIAADARDHATSSQIEA